MCNHRFDESFQQEHTPNAQAYVAAAPSFGDQNWYPDSEASHHITSNLANLNLKAEEYGGSDQICVGNGTGLSIKHIGTAQISTPSFKFKLNNVLHVPQIIKKFIICASIYQSYQNLL
jgi:hypothetical protein